MRNRIQRKMFFITSSKNDTTASFIHEYKTEDPKKEISDIYHLANI